MRNFLFEKGTLAREILFLNVFSPHYKIICIFDMDENIIFHPF
jgi:hypothetical protein